MEAVSDNFATDQTPTKRLERIFSLQKKAFLSHPYPSAAQRIELMERIPEMLRKNREKILAALHEDFGGHSEKQGDLVEILGMFDRAKYNIANVKKWMKPLKKEVNPVTLGSSKAFLKYHPKGVVGNMVSWNFPFDIGLGPTLDLLAAGNRVIIKPSDLSPACGKVLEEMISETFDEDQVAVVNGGLDLAIHFPSLKWDHLVYTGSGAVGRKVMKAAAENLVPVTLELGGKSPAIVHTDSVTDETVRDIAGVKVVKRGQMCVTVDYCLVPASRLDVFTDKMIAHFQANFAEGNCAEHACGIITDRHMKRLQSLVDEAVDAGVEVTQIGENVAGGSRNMPFYIVKNPPRDLGLMKEEIFGPILPIIPYDDTSDAIRFVNADDKPLGLYIFSGNQNFTDTISEQTQSGGVAVNIAALQAAQPSLPFGGIGESGMGLHHGIEAFREFSNPRGYFIKGKGGTFDAITPPYGSATEHLIHDVAYAPMGKQILFALKRLPGDLWKRMFT